ncbi:hypothetical protein [Novosphingobium capsulatum]|uniref:hypothetical protein n=1 Tax=Novosphingobium capsulatum TaxID=13688 RepID=UPI000787602B|nr:hypothetical protein [Novosphingobium capsulatum]WQD92579.1 hypothetical protein U0041_16550 [Novosphingobium capsulatum]
MNRQSDRSRRKARAEIRHQHATRRLAQHEDDLLEASDAWGVAGVVLGLAGFLWMAARCGPTLFPSLF